MPQGLLEDQLVKKLGWFPDRDLACAIARNIDRRTGGRIHRLQVELTDGRAFVHGCTASEGAKLFALFGALEVLGANNRELIVMAIQVVATASAEVR